MYKSPTAPLKQLVLEQTPIHGNKTCATHCHKFGRGMWVFILILVSLLSLPPNVLPMFSPRSPSFSQKTFDAAAITPTYAALLAILAQRVTSKSSASR